MVGSDTPSLTGATALLLVRHGQTKWNATGRVQGVSDTGLDATGVEQSRRLGVRLAPIPVAAIYASDLARAADTARIVRQHLSSSVDVPLRLCRELREFGYGTWEGKTRDELEEEGWGEALRRWHAGLPTRMPEGAETRQAAIARVDRFLASVPLRHPGETIIVVAHGGTLRLMLCRMLGLLPGQWGQVRIANTGLSKVTMAPGRRPRVDFVNDASHLRGMKGATVAGPLQSGSPPST